MSDQEHRSSQVDDLRRRAEEIAQQRAAQTPEALTALSPEAARALLHNLQVHQIELEMQNEELRHAQEALETSRERYFDLYDLAPVGYITLSEAGLILEANLTIARLLGVTRGALPRQPLPRFILREDQDIYYHHRQALFATGAPQECELRLLPKDGAPFWAHLQATAATDADGAPQCRVVLSDISARKETEAALRESEGLYHSLAENIQDYIMRYDRHYRHIYANAAAIAATGLPREQYLGKTHREMGFPTELCELWEGAIGRAFATGQLQREVFTWQSAQGEMTLDWRAVPEFRADGSVATVLALSRDITALRQGEQALRESEAFVQTLMDAIPAPIFYRDVNSRFLGCNEAHAAFRGVTKSDLVGKTVYETSPHELAEQYAQMDRELVNHPGTQAYETVAVRADGARRNVMMHRASFNDAAGNVRGIVAVALDITERVQAEKALRESEANFRNLVESMTEGVVIGAADGRHIYANRYAAELLRYTPEEMLQTTQQDLADPAAYPLLRQRLQDRIAGRPLPTTYEAIIRRKDGTSFPADITGTRTVWQGQPCDLVLLRDITARKQAEEELRESQALIEAVVENIPLMLFLKEATDLRFVMFNRAGEELLGYDRKALLGKNNLDLFPPEQAAHFMAKDREVLDGKLGMLDIPEEAILTAKQGQRLLHTRKACILGADGNTKYLLGISEDITERKRVEEALRESEERFRGLFDNSLSGVALHEIVVNDQGEPVDYIYLMANQAFETHTGMRVADIVGKRVTQTHPGIAESGLIATYGRVALTGVPTSFETYFEPLQRNYSISAFQVGQGRFATVFEDITARKRAEAVQAFLARTASGTADEPFFQTLARYLAQSLGMDFVCIDRLEGDGLNARTLAVWCDGHFEDNMTYALKDTPCGDVVGKAVCCFPASVCQFFPRDQVLQDLRAESYVGVTLFDHRGRPIGLIAVISRRPLVNRAQIEAIMQTVGLRAASELERLDAEEALRVALVKYKTLFDSFPLGITVSDPAGGILESNQMAESLLGVSQKEQQRREIGGEVWRIVRPDGAPMPAEEYASVRALKEHRRVENQEMGIVKPGGEITWISVTAAPLPLDGYGVVITYIDITARKQAEEALRTSEERFKTMFEQAPLGITLADSQTGRYQMVNPTFARMVGRTIEDVTNGDWMSITHPDDLQKDVEQMALLNAGKIATYQMEKRYLCPDGTPVWIDMTVAPIIKDPAHPQHLCMAADITARKQMEEEQARLQEQLVQAQKMESVGRLAGGVAHDFNNMLQAILGYTAMTLGEVEPHSTAYDNLLEVQRAAQHSADLTRQLLAFARRQIMSPKVLDLNETVSNMLKMLQRLIGEDIHLAFVPGGTLWMVRMDPSQVDQILANLVSNARDAIRGVGKITIETNNVTLDAAYCAEHHEFTPGDYVLLVVSDTGVGMDKETLSHLFEPFFTTKAMGQGTGLGLSMVYGIIKQNDGSINVYSEVGQGTTFRIYLPRFSASATTEVKAAASPMPRGAETILLVEDEAAILNMGRRILTSLGYTVLSAPSAEEAQRLAAEHQGEIHLLITDVVMPEMNGRDLAARLVALKPGLRTLFMSGYTANVIAHHGILEEGVYFIQKPFSVPALAAKVREALGS